MRRVLIAASCLAAFAAAACSGNDGDGVDGSPDASSDAAPAARRDAAVDAQPATPEAGAGDASPDAPAQPDAGPDAFSEGGAVEGGVVPSHCMDLSGEYLMNTDHFTLTRASCGALTWVKEKGYFDPNGWTHAYTTDGVARNVTDETGAAIVEEAHVDDAAMYVHRTSAGSDVHQKVYWSTQPCDLLGPDGVYLTRETFDAGGKQTACEFWSLLDHCASGTNECDGDPKTRCETQTGTDPDHCGSCNVQCGTNNTTTAACVSGRCALTCAAGFADCNGSASDGCEADTQNDIRDCGACGTWCSGMGTTSVSCQKGACTVTCDATDADCDGNGANGCEIDTSRNGLSCGTCGNDCGGGACEAGQCKAHGTTLAKVTSDTTPKIGVDATSLYYYDDSVSTLYAVDKVQGGAPKQIATRVSDFTVGGGTMYYVTQTQGAFGPSTLWQWSSATGTATTVATSTTAIHDVSADASSVAWDESTDPNYDVTHACAIRFWSVGDATAHTLYTKASHEFLTIAAMNATDVLFWEGTDLYRMPRAGGTPVEIGSFTVGYPGVLADDSYAYLHRLEGIVRLPLAPSDAGPVTGEPALWWASSNTAGFATDGVSLFTLAYDPLVSDVVQVSKADAPVATPVAYGSAYHFALAVDTAAVYVFDSSKQEIRRVPR